MRCDRIVHVCIGIATISKGFFQSGYTTIIFYGHIERTCMITLLPCRASDSGFFQARLFYQPRPQGQVHLHPGLLCECVRAPDDWKPLSR